MNTSSRGRILAVDDRPANLVTLDAVLGDRYEVIRANSGPEAIAILERDPNIDVILMDIQMPGMDGYEATARIKKLPGCEDIPLVFITAVYSQDPHIKRGYAAGAVDYFTKPFDPDILRLKVDVFAAFRRRAAVLKVKERQLRESQDVLRAGRKLASVLEGLPVGVIIVDAEGRICQTNEEVLRIVGSSKAVASDAYEEVLAWWEGSELAVKHGRSPLARSLEGGRAIHNEVVRIECLDGTKKDVLESTSPLRGLGGAILGVVVVLQDVTESKRFEADFEERITRLVSLSVEFEDGSPTKAWRA
jgi:PAS domain S-box-containing protein